MAMEERRFLIRSECRPCRIGKKKGVMRTVRIEERLQNGKRVPMHLAIHFETDGKKDPSQELLRSLRAVADKRRAA